LKKIDHFGDLGIDAGIKYMFIEQDMTVQAGFTWHRYEQVGGGGALVNMVMNLQIQNAGNFSTS
jgi:hypothetical protein